MGAHIRQDLTAAGMRRELKEYFEVELSGDQNKIVREEFVGRYMNTGSEFAIKLASRIYDEFEEQLISKALGGEPKQEARTVEAVDKAADEGVDQVLRKS